MLLLVDVQERILPLVQAPQHVVTQCTKMIESAYVLGLPVLATEQYPRGLGHTVPTLQHLLARKHVAVIEKPAFSCWAEDRVRTAICDLNRSQIIVIGIETHVCIQQTALDLAAANHSVFVCADAVSGRGKENHHVALDRMRSAGVVISTVESVMFELCGRTDIPRFKPMLEIVKAFPPTDD